MSDEPIDDRPWGEEQWERLLRESEVRSARYRELLETLLDHPDRDARGPYKCYNCCGQHRSVPVFTVEIPISDSKFEKLKIARLSADDARQIVERLTGDQMEPIYIYKDEDNEESLTIMGGLGGKFVCEWRTLDVSELLLRPGCDQLSRHEKQVANNDCAWYPVEAIVDKDMAVDVLVKYVKNGAIPRTFSWMP